MLQLFERPPLVFFLIYSLCIYKSIKIEFVHKYAYIIFVY